MEIKEVVEKINTLYREMVEADKESKALLADTKVRAEAVTAREVAIVDKESANDALTHARKLTGALEAKQNEIDAARADFGNYEREALARIADATAALQVLKDQEIQLRKDREALEAEKLSYRETIRKEMVAHFQNTKN